MPEDNLPAVRTEPPATAVVARDTDSWAERLPQVVELARAISNTDFVPEALRNNVAATTAAVLYGREVGLPPMTALSNVNVIKGRPGLSAVIMRAQVLAAGHEIRQDESTSALCTMSGRRRGTDYWQTVTYSIDDARQAGLLQQNKNYEKNPRRMLRARATSELCELMFADVVRGMPSYEELEELDDDSPAGPPAPTQRAKVQRKARTPKNDDGAAPLAGTDSSPAAPSSPPMPPLPGEPGYDDPSSASGITGQEDLGDAPGKASAPPEPDGILPLTEPDAEAAASAQSAAGVPRVPAASASDPEVVDEPRMITRAQQRGMFAIFKELGIDDDAERLHITSALVGRTPMHQGKPSSNGLTFDEANTLTAALSTCKTRDHVEALIELAEQGRADADVWDAEEGDEP
jgi:hypothetical protein